MNLNSQSSETEQRNEGGHPILVPLEFNKFQSIPPPEKDLLKITGLDPMDEIQTFRVY